jgi:hypothetical protein
LSQLNKNEFRYEIGTSFAAELPIPLLLDKTEMLKTVDIPTVIAAVIEFSWTRHTFRTTIIKNKSDIQ